MNDRAKSHRVDTFKLSNGVSSYSPSLCRHGVRGDDFKWMDYIYIVLLAKTLYTFLLIHTPTHSLGVQFLAHRTLDSRR